MKSSLIKLFSIAVIAVSITGCGASILLNLSGIGGSGFVSSGVITAFGSVFVNGVKYEVDNAVFDVDGNIDGTEDDLAIGMIVQVNGIINDDGVTGTATSISFDDEIQGEVTDITISDGFTRSFMILGVNVIINTGTTTFDLADTLPLGTPFSFSDIKNANNVEISGFYDTVGNLIATRVELKELIFSINSIVEIKGIIKNSDGINFSLGNLTVDASIASIKELPNGLINDQLVEVKGTISSTNITASEIKGEDTSIDDTDEFELEGIITNYIDNSDFKINGITVDASSTTLILEDDILVEAEGSIKDGILIATEIELRGGNAKVRATVSDIDSFNNTFDVKPVASQPAITIFVSNITKLEDDTNGNTIFTLDNLMTGDYVEVHGFDNGNESIDATEVQVKDPENIVVQGVIQSGDATTSTIKVLGVEFLIDDLHETSFEGLNDNLINQATFFSNVILNSSIIKIEDEDANGTADEIEIESL